MDWSNNSWVKLYVRESADELRMGWQAWALFQKLLRHSDRSGVLEYAGEQDLPILAAMARMPESVVSDALPKVIASGCVVAGNGYLTIRNKHAASEARKSDRLRQRESRERRRDDAMNGPKVTERDQTSHHAVTKRDDLSHAVTCGHDVSHDVTIRREEKRREEKSPTGGAPAAGPGDRIIIGSLKRRRKALKLRQPEVAAFCQVGSKTVSAWETGTLRAEPHQLARYAEMLDRKEASKKPTGDHAAFIAWFNERYERHHGCKPTWGGREGKTVKELLSKHSRAEIERRAEIMFQMCPAWPATSPTLATLAQHFDVFGSAPRSDRRMGGSAPAGSAEAHAREAGKSF